MTNRPKRPVGEAARANYLAEVNAAGQGENEHDGLKEWMAATIIAITVTTTPVFGADYAYERGPVIVEPRPPVIVEEPPAVVVAPPPVVEQRCRRETVRKYDEEGDFHVTEEKETCD